MINNKWAQGFGSAEHACEGWFAYVCSGPTKLTHGNSKGRLNAMSSWLISSRVVAPMFKDSEVW